MWAPRRWSKAKGDRKVASGRQARAARRLVREVEAFLTGSSQEWFFTRGRDIPGWAYINKVAHAEPTRLAQLAAWAPDESTRCRGWREAVGILARDTIRAGACDPRAIRHIQIDRLVAGSLPDAERRTLLLRIETEPDGWRQCALAFLEAQKQHFAKVVVYDFEG